MYLVQKKKENGWLYNLLQTMIEIKESMLVFPLHILFEFCYFCNEIHRIEQESFELNARNRPTFLVW